VAVYGDVTAAPNPSGRRAPSAADPTRVLLLIAVRLFREGFADYLDEQHDLVVVDAAASAAAVLPHVQELQPDVVVADTVAGEPAGLLELRARLPEAHVVLLGVPERERAILDYIRAGVIGYTATDASIEDVLGAVRAAAQNEVTCPAPIAAILMRHVSAGSGPEGAREVLSRRETEILELIDEGLMNKEIARHLHIEVGTVKNHVHSIFKKLQVHRRSDAAAALRARQLAAH
jgi:two-component system, NarL family, nitrate/nitrite response regulator NarL